MMIGSIRLPDIEGFEVEWDKPHTLKSGRVVIWKDSKYFYKKDKEEAEKFLERMKNEGHPEAKMFECFF